MLSIAIYRIILFPYAFVMLARSSYILYCTGARSLCYCFENTRMRQSLNPLKPDDFHVFEWFSAFTRPIGFRDSIFKVTMESAAVLKH